MTHHCLRLSLFVMCGLGLLAAEAAAQPPGQQPRLELSVSPTIVTFAPADPDVMPQIASPPMTVNYRVRNLQNQSWLLTVLASGNLISASSTVDITNVTWVATPAPPFRNGTLNRTVAQVMASGVGNVNPTATGSVTFRLNNSWTYDSGIYTQTIVFTLSLP